MVKAMAKDNAVAVLWVRQARAQGVVAALLWMQDARQDRWWEEAEALVLQPQRFWLY